MVTLFYGCDIIVYKEGDCVIYIISGVAKSGKTLIAKEITNRYQIPYFSTDYIMMMLFHGNKNLNIDIDASDSTVSNQLEPYLFGLISTMIENKVDYLLEGVHFNPDFSSKLYRKFKNDIRIVYLGYKEVSASKKIEELFKYQDQIENKWYSHFDDKKMRELIEYLISESKRIASSCRDLNLHYIEVSDLNHQKEDVIAMIINK